MSKEFCLGLALGMIGGALLVTNSKKVRNFVREKQIKLSEKIKSAQDDLTDEK